MNALEPLSHRDIATLERAVKRYQALGFEASFGLSDQAEGRAAIWYVDPRSGGSDTFQLDIEKYAGQHGIASWLIRISRAAGVRMTMSDMGQVSSNILLFALANAERVIAGEREPDIPPAVEEKPVQVSRSELVSLDKLATELEAPKAASKAASKAAQKATPKNGSRSAPRKLPDLDSIVSPSPETPPAPLEALLHDLQSGRRAARRRDFGDDIFGDPFRGERRPELRR
jgi:hypothetical protein